MAPRWNGRATATAIVQAPVRCAVYCRVSTNAQADKEFNSVEAQQETCQKYKAYIEKSVHADQT